MNCDVTITAADFKIIHNTLWGLQYADMDPQAAAEQIRAALGDAYAQDNAAFERKHDHYHSVQQQLGLKTIWSIFEVEDLAAEHPYKNAREICYRDHWGEEPIYETIEGSTWAALFVAADRCIQRSGDQHHVFIEAFEPVAKMPHQLRLTTGS